jgi:hypothetical protein
MPSILQHIELHEGADKAVMIRYGTLHEDQAVQSWLHLLKKKKKIGITIKFPREASRTKGSIKVSQTVLLLLDFDHHFRAFGFRSAFSMQT